MRDPFFELLLGVRKQGFITQSSRGFGDEKIEPPGQTL